MKVLVVSTQFPYPPRSGFETRVYQLCLQLAKAHEVTLLSYASAEDRVDVAALAEQFPVRIVEREPTSVARKRATQLRSLASPLPFACREVKSQPMQSAIDELCSSERFDVIQLESVLLTQYEMPAGPAVILDEHNVEYDLFRRLSQGERSIPRRAYNGIEHARVRRFEQAAWNRVDGCLVASGRELAIVREHAPGTAAVAVPNGVDLEYFQPSERPVDLQTAVFNGVLEYRPNLDAALYLVEEIWPLVVEDCPHARLTLVGRGPLAALRRLSRPGVVVAGEVPDVRPHLERAAVVAVPIRMGGGTRLKVVEGLALGKAIVSTTVGCEGIAVADGTDLLIADDARGFADRIIDLFTSETLRRSLGINGRALVEREYSWELAGERIGGLLERLAPRRDLARARP